MNRIKHSAQKPDDRPGLRATDRAVPSARASGALLSAPIVGRKRTVAISAILGVAAVLGLLLSASAAFAANLPRISLSVPEAEVHATRASLIAEVDAENVEGSEAVSYRVEYSTSESGQGTLVSSGTVEAGHSASAGGVAQHLTPNTTYYAHIVAENALGHPEETVRFTTAPAPEAPEIQVGLAQSSQNGEFELGTTFATLQARIQTNGAATEYDLEYTTEPANPFSWVPVTSGATGSVTVAEDFASREAHLIGLTPETTYYVRATAKNSIGESKKIEGSSTSFTTATTLPTSASIIGAVFDVGGTSAFVSGDFKTHSSETHWRVEYATSESAATWTSGPEGTVTAAEAKEGFSYVRPLKVSGLSPSTTYYVRLFAENAHGNVTSRSRVFTTAGPPAATTFAAHAFAPGSETLRVLGSVEAHTEPIDELQTVTLGGSPTGGVFTLAFAGQTTAPLPFDATKSEVLAALEALSSIGKGNVQIVSEEASGFPYTVEFVGSLGGADQPQLTADASGLVPSGTVTVATLQDGFSYDTRAHFEYVTQKHFEAEGFTNSAETPALDIGAGSGTREGSSTYGVDLPGLQAGESYRYRILATNTTPGNPVVTGEEQDLSVPAAAEGGEEACPNEALRSGPSAHLPDCRAYELVTPADKEGSMDTFNYGNVPSNALVGEDGEHVFVNPQGAKWGQSPDATNTSYFFSREAGKGWRMTSTTPQPQAAQNSYGAELFNSDLTQVGLNVGWSSALEIASPNLEYKLGAPGGPYASVATIPRKQVSGGWVAADADFSKLILQSEARTLASGHSTGTTSGSDLYEYAEGQFRQLNVTGPAPGTTIGRCGARIARGLAEPNSVGDKSSPHAVSTDGSRVFFEAVPGSNCGEPSHLYMRTNGAETLDIGPYTFLAANKEGTELILEKKSAEVVEILLYHTESATAEPLFSTGEPIHELAVSEDLTAIYFRSGGPNNLYRYDISTRALRFTGVQATATDSNAPSYVSPDGRYFYFISPDVAGVFSEREHVLHERAGAPPAHAKAEDQQIYRYDSTENVVECISCASPFAPRPASSVEETIFKFRRAGGLDP